MGMTIDEHIKTLESYGKGRKGFTGQPIDFQASINFAINTMRKYQKIKEIVERFKNQYDHTTGMDLIMEIKEVIEDGKND